MTIQKLASQAPAVLLEAGNHLRKMASENVSLSQENATLRRELHLNKLAHRMEDRGLEPALNFEQKLAHLHDVEEQKLASLEQAIEMSAGGFKLASLQDTETDNSSLVQEQGTNESYALLDSFFLSGRAVG